MVSKEALPADILRPKVHSSLVSSTVAFALAQGLSVVEIETATGTSIVDLVNPDSRLNDDMVGRLWRALSDRFPHETLPLRMAAAAPLMAPCGLPPAAGYAPNLREALSFMIANRTLVADRADLSLKEEGPLVVLKLSHPADRIDSGRAAEMMVATLFRMVSEIFGVTGGVASIEFAHARWAPLDDYAAFFAAPVAFNRGRNAMLFPKEMMEREIDQSNAEMFEYVRKYFEQQTAQLPLTRYPAKLRPLVEAVISNASVGEYSATLAAARAKMSFRSAQRLASEAGTTLQRLIEDTRSTQAKRLLANHKLSVGEIGHLLGYSEESAFRRACIRWTGVSPAQYRRDSS
ncbi:MAG: AraC family transcriptional regulator ligand-binding domain-containing protein [Pseudomonadota bacterium]